MARGPLFQDGYRHQFSGHETFPLRYGWLKKAFDEVCATEEQGENKWVFLREDSIARFGVGKNMVASMRHWATASGMIKEGTSQCLATTQLGRKLLSKKGLDPFMEHPATLWLVHWQLAARADKTTWFWAFNHYPAITFERETLIKGLDRLAKERSWSRVAAATLKNDVACFIRTYVAQQPTWQAWHDDALESPLTELGLIRAVGRRDGFRFVRGPKSTLGDGVFIYGLIDFWMRYTSAATLSFEAIAHEPGGPGRVFVLDENDVADRLVMLDKVTNGALRWSETAGLKQVVRDGDLNLEAALKYIDNDFKAMSREAA